MKINSTATIINNIPEKEMSPQNRNGKDSNAGIIEKNITAGLFGLGCVGQGFYELLSESAGVKADIAKVCVKNKNKTRAYKELKYTYDKDDIFSLVPLDAVVELTNDADNAFHIIKEALKRKIPVVTANKKMVAEHFEELYQLQLENKTSLLYEAAVGGSIPIIRCLEEYYDNDLLFKVKGVLNGTCNYILTKMELENLDYKSALADSQEKGFAELDPWLDVSGSDAKYKILILTIHAFGIVLKTNSVLNLGIQNISFADIEFAKARKCRIKMISCSEKIDGKFRVFAIPHFVDEKSSLYNVMNEFNAVELESSHSCSQVIIGKGAGKHPTGSAVLSDVSALTFDYKYSYKKLKRKSLGNFSIESGAKLLECNFPIKLYIRFRDLEDLKMLNVISIEEEGNFKDSKYIIAHIGFESLFNLKGESNSLFIAIV